MKPEDFDTIRQKEIEKQLITTRIKNGKKKHIKNLKMKAQTCQIVNSLISQSEKEINTISEHLNPVRTIIVPSSFHRKMTSITTNNTISHHNNSSVIKAQRKRCKDKKVREKMSELAKTSWKNPERKKILCRSRKYRKCSDENVDRLAPAG